MSSAQAERNHSAGQRRIMHYCSCGRAVAGNPGWASHRKANPEHTSITYTMWLEIEDRKLA